MKKSASWILLGVFFLGTPALFAEEPAEKTSMGSQIGALEKRGFLNLATCPAEFVTTFAKEKKDHPKAWPATYLPQSIMNFGVRLTSGVNDIAVYPWKALAKGETIPVTRRFDLPDYLWQKE